MKRIAPNLVEEIKLMHDYENIIGESEVLKYVLYRLEQIAPLDTTVLILGETGTGKELIARAIHHGSRRKLRHLKKSDGRERSSMFPYP